MPRRHMDNSTRINTDRILGASGRKSLEKGGLWRRDLDRMGQGRNGRPIVDRQLESEADRAGMIHTRFEGHAGKGPKNYRRSDERIREDVCEALFRSYDVDASDVEVEVKDGCVYLKGMVDSRDIKRLAEDAVENIFGVIDVQNQLTFKRVGPVVQSKMTPPENEFGTRPS